MSLPVDASGRAMLNPRYRPRAPSEGKFWSKLKIGRKDKGKGRQKGKEVVQQEKPPAKTSSTNPPKPSTSKKRPSPSTDEEEGNDGTTATVSRLPTHTAPYM